MELDCEVIIFAFLGSLGVNNVFQNSSALIDYFSAVQTLTQGGLQEVQKMNFTKVRTGVLTSLHEIHINLITALGMKIIFYIVVNIDISKTKSFYD